MRASEDKSRRWDSRLDRAGEIFQKNNAAKRCPRLVLKKKSGCRKFSLMLETKSGCRAFCTRRTKAPWSVFNARRLSWLGQRLARGVSKRGVT